MSRAGPSSSSRPNSVELQQEAQRWVEEVTEEPFEGPFAEELRSGRRLCLLINKIKPGAVRRVNTSKMPFKQMENISNFLKAIREIGVKEYNLFETVDLFELKDVGLVVQCLHALGGTVQLACPDFEGPHLGLKSVSRSPPKSKALMTRTWQKPAAAYVPEPRPTPSLPSSTAASWVRGAETMPASVAAPIPVIPANEEAWPEEDGEDLPPPAFDESKSPPPSELGVEQGYEGRANAAEMPPAYNESATRWSHVQEINDDEAEEDMPPPPPYQDVPFTMTTTAVVVPPSSRQPDALSPKFSEAVRVSEKAINKSEALSPKFAEAVHISEKAGTSGNPSSLAMHQQHQQQHFSVVSAPSTKSCSPPRSEAASGASLSPTSIASATPQMQESFPPTVEKGVRGGGYGLDAELAAKREANYDHDAEVEAQEWIENVTNESFASDFEEELRDGRRLCILINTIKPGAVRKVNNSRMPFKQMENISNFLRACRSVGVAEHSLFETVDLFEEKDIGLVVRCLHALGQTVQKTCPEYQGPRLGIKQTDANKREWTAEQQAEQKRKSSGAMTQLMAGSSGTMERGTILKQGVTFGASTSGTGDTSTTGLWSMGSSQIMERSTVTKSGPTFGAAYVGTGDRNSVSKITQGFR